MQYYQTKLLVHLSLIILLTGCATTSYMNKTPEYNSILKNQSFQEAFKARHIKLVAPASGTDPEKIETLKTLAKLNIDVPHNIMTKEAVFHANTDETRFKLLKDALYDRSKTSVIWTLRGGYGSARLIDKLKILPKPKHEKLFIGFSDNTALHLFLSQEWQWKTIHGAGLAEILNPERDPQNFQKIADIIANKISILEITDLKPLNPEAQKLKKLSGLLTGGNLTTIQSGIKTSWQIKPAGKILFLEDIGEKGYRIDRALHHLKQAGILKGVKAIVFGEFADSPEDVNIALTRFAQDTPIPIYQTNQFGHGKINYPLIYNAKSEILPMKDPKNFMLLMHLKN